ncbi:MAG: ATP-grasp domain-containing protein [Planctomycetaceae bacterium]
MKIFIAEYFTSGLCPGVTHENSLYQEGWGMLSALLEDVSLYLNETEGECVTLLGGAPVSALPVNIQIQNSQSPAEAHQLFQKLVSDADQVYIIAPETEGVLLQLYDEVAAQSAIWMGCDRNAIQLCSDKWELGLIWRSLGLPTPVTTQLMELKSPEQIAFPIIVKPRDGAGGDQTWRFDELSEFERFFQFLTADERELYLLQPYVPGVACSVSLLSVPGRDYQFPPGEQRIEWREEFHYLGGKIPCCLSDRAQMVLDAALSQIRLSIPGLNGYWGLDFIWNENDAESPITLIEINPRLTTSYLGYRQLTEQNLAQLWFGQAMQLVEQMSDIIWKSGPVEF